MIKNNAILNPIHFNPINSKTTELERVSFKLYNESKTSIKGSKPRISIRMIARYMYHLKIDLIRQTK